MHVRATTQTWIILVIACVTSLALLYYKVQRTFEKFVALQEFIYIPPQKNVGSFGEKNKCGTNRGNSCDTMHDLTSLGPLPPTVLSGGITVQSMGPLGPMHVGGDPNPYANLYFNSMNVFR